MKWYPTALNNKNPWFKDEINLDIKWKKIKFKFEGLRKGLRHITHWIMNKVNDFKKALYGLFPVLKLLLAVFEPSTYLWFHKNLSSNPAHSIPNFKLPKYYTKHLLGCLNSLS